MATLGSMIVNVLANTSGFVAGMSRARSEMKKTRAEASVTQSAVAALGSVRGILLGIGAGFSVNALAGSLQRTADEIDDLVKVSERLGITTEALGGLQFGASLAGIEANQLNSALGFMSKQLAEAAHGAGKAKVVIKELGLDARALAKMTPDEALIKFANALSGVKDESERVRIALRVFGSAGEPLLTFLNEGESAIRGYMDEHAKLGLSVSKEEAKKVEAYNDAWEKLGKSFGRFKQDFVINVTPLAIKLVDDLQKLFDRSEKKEGNLGDYMPFDMQDEIAGYHYKQYMSQRNKHQKTQIGAFGRYKKYSEEELRSVGLGRKDFYGFEKGAFTKAELEASRKKLDPRFAPGGRGEELAGRPLWTDESTRKLMQFGGAKIRTGVDAVVGAWQQAGAGLRQIDKIGAEWGKKNLVQNLLGSGGRARSKYEADLREAKVQAEKAAKQKQEQEMAAAKKQQLAQQLRVPAPTVTPGSAAAQELGRSLEAQQLQLKEQKQTNDHLRGIKDALTPGGTGL